MLPVSDFVFITYSWHLTRTGSAAPGFGKKEQVVDEQVSLTHLHGSTRKNKRERWRLQRKKKKKKEREEWRVPLDAVCNAAGRLPARDATEFQTCQSSWLSSSAEGKGREKFHKRFWYLRDGTARLSSRIFKSVFHTRDSGGVPGEVSEKDAHTITLYRIAYARIKSCLCGCWKIQQHSFIPQTRNVRPFLAKASCSQTSHCLQGDEQNACTRRVSKWERVYGPCRFSI